MTKTAFITGSTSGIGLGIAKKFAEKGYNIVLNGFGQAAAIEQLQNSFTEIFGIQADYCDANMKNPKEIREKIGQIIEKFGKIDILVNNAGIQFVEKVENFPTEKWDDIIAINLSAAFHTIASVIPKMQQQNFGRIINVASAHGLIASPEKSAYVAAKHGIVGLTKVVALENAKKGITVNAICPGWVLTDLVKQQIEANAEKNGQTFEEAKKDLVSGKHPSEEFATPEQIGEAAVFLALSDSSSITGTTLSIDGGWTAM